ncbi:MAG: hypothetical protein ACI936_000996 [Paraglaciecola sp.]|jgi:hypothetical protein
MQLGKLITYLSLTCFLWLNAATNKPAYAETERLVGFEAEYTVYRFGRSLGKARLNLKADEDNLYRLDYYSKVSAFFLSDVRSETSFFSYENTQLRPYTYAYSRSGTGSNKSTKINFDAEKSEIVINQAQPIEWLGQLDNQLYRLDVQLKLASGKREFAYDIVNNRGQLRHYELKVVGKEQLDLPFGMIEGIEVKIIRKNSSRETIAWFSPQLNYQLVKLKQFKDGDEQGEIRLKYFKTETSQSEAKN